MKNVFKILIIVMAMISLFACSKNDENAENSESAGANESTATSAILQYNLSQGMEMPNIVVETNKGTTFDLSKVDKPVFINFWATWCPPCRAEMPYIQNLYEEYGHKVDFILIDLGENKEIVQDFLVENEIFTFPVGYDVSNTYGDRFNVTGIPTTYIVGKDKIINNYIVGMRTESQYKEYIEAVLSK